MDQFGLVQLAVRLPRRQPAGAARHGLPHLLAQHLDGVMRARLPATEHSSVSASPL